MSRKQRRAQAATAPSNTSSTSTSTDHPQQQQEYLDPSVARKITLPSTSGLTAHEIPMSRPDYSKNPSNDPNRAPTLLDIAQQRQRELYPNSTTQPQPHQNPTKRRQPNSTPTQKPPSSTRDPTAPEQEPTFRLAGENVADVEGDIPPLFLAPLYGVTLSMLHFTLDVLVWHQYGQEIEWRILAARAVFRVFPLLTVAVFVMHEPWFGIARRSEVSDGAAGDGVDGVSPAKSRDGGVEVVEVRPEQTQEEEDDVDETITSPTATSTTSTRSPPTTPSSPASLFSRFPTLQTTIFLLISLASGAYAIHTTNIAEYLAVMRRAPPAGVLWVWATVELAKWEALGSLVVLGAWAAWGGYGFW
ncbi:MAG: hypothetical protein M1831_004348 [Alyxoria varia]|nr:MAG: hypothetical protein M1831_004348 [Alyxoria varia]